MEEVAKAVLAFFNEHDIFAWLALGGLGLVFLAFILGSIGDLGEGIREFRFWLWLRKNDNFARFSTFSDARRGMEREREEREYARATRRLRKRMEKRKGISRELPLKERILAARDRLYCFCDRVGCLWDDLAAYAARRKISEKPEERDGRGQQ